MVAEGIMSLVHLNSVEYNLKEKMAEQTRQLRLSHAQMTGVFKALLALPHPNKPLHPSQERSKYAELREWLLRAMADVVRTPQRPGKAVCEQEQRVMVALLQQLGEMGRKECAEKGALLQVVKEYLINTLNAYWRALQNASREVWYQFQHNTVRVQREYISELKRLQGQNQELRKDKDHRWRNMFMLIKDNRIHRRQNRKLLTSISYQMEKNVALAEQMILLREQNQKLKVKLACLENDPVRVQAFAETQVRMAELRESIRSYPKRSKKILKNDLVKIEIQQINNLNDKIKFIIKAIQETGEIIDEFYDEETIWTNFHYNISTQTEPNALEEKATNTPILRMVHTEAAVTPAALNNFQVIETYNLIIRGAKKQRKETKDRESKMPAFASTFNGRFISRREQSEKVRETSSRQRMVDSQFSICESVKMTIHNGRISYISTYNTEIFNGPDILRRIEQKIQNQAKTIKEVSKPEQADAEVQTEQHEEPVKLTRLQSKQRTKFTSALPLFNIPIMDSAPRNRPRLKITQQVKVEINNVKGKSQHLKVKFVPFPLTQKEAAPAKPNLSDHAQDSSRKQTRNGKRLNSLERFYGQPEKEKPIERMQFSTQTEEPPVIKVKQLVSIGNLQSKDEPSLTNPTTNSNNSSFLQDANLSRKNGKNKAFNQSMDSLMPTKPKSKPRRSDMSPLKTIQPKKMQKVSRAELLKHKRTSTEAPENEQLTQNLLNPNRQFRMKPLHRISQVLTEGDLTREDVLNPQPRQKEKGLPMTISKEGQIRAGDFAKGVQKILRSMDVRRNQILSNNHSLKTYLSSYFKCLYGREIYTNFIIFLSNTEPQESVICFSRLANPKAPQAYLVDIFKAFVKSVAKCYVLGQSPCSSRLRQEVLKYLAGLFLEDEDTTGFALRMRNRGCYTLMGWFNCLQQELRTEAIHSELYSLLSLWLGDPTDALPYDFIQELAYFMQPDPSTTNYLIRCKVFLREGVPLHRFCLFGYRYQWTRMLQLRTSIQEDYTKRVGGYYYEEAVRRIEHHHTILLQFKHLERCYSHCKTMWDRYGSTPDRHLIMLIELSIQEYRLKYEMPLSRELKYLSLVFQGLQKKKQYETLKAKLDSGQGKENIINSKIAL